VAPEPGPTSGTITGGAGGLWYHVVGSGPDTVLIPLGTWLEDSLAPLGNRHTLVFYDPRHRGRSHLLRDSTDATFDGDVADLEAVRNGLALSRVAVLGWDYYAAVAAAWAAAHPAAVTRLVLLSPIEPADSLSRAWQPRERAARLDTVAARRLVRDRAAGRDTTDPAGYCRAFWRVNAPLFVHDPARAAALDPGWCVLPNEAPPRLAAATGPALESLGPGTDVGARAAGIAAPVLVIHGREDLVSNPDGALDWARRFPDARILWMRGAGHLPWIDMPATLRSAIDFFLTGRWPPLAERPASDPERRP
jgi:pimeloyl-ACP methyl ester carboxylesterase